MFNLPGEVYTGKAIISAGNYEGPGYYACPRTFPGQETYRWHKQLEADASRADIDYWGRQLGTLTEIASQADFDRITSPPE